MQKRLFPRTDTYNSFVLIRRLLTEYGLVRWRHYTLVFALMGVAALCTGLAAYLMGDVVNRAFDGREFGAVVQIGVMAFGVFTLRGLALYGQAVMLSRIGNSIIAENQLRMYSKLLQHNLSFFAERHSSEATFLPLSALSP